MSDDTQQDRDARICKAMRGIDEDTGPGCVSQARVEMLEAEIFKALHNHENLASEFNRCQTTVIQELNKVTNRLDAIPDTTHTQHHRLLDQLIAERELRVDFWSEVRKRVTTAGVLATFGLIGTALIFAFKAWMKKMGT